MAPFGSMLSMSPSWRLVTPSSLRGRPELHPVAPREAALGLAVDRHALRATRIVADSLAAQTRHGDPVLLGTYAHDMGVFAIPDAELPAAFRIADHVTTWYCPAQARSAPASSGLGSRTRTVSSRPSTRPMRAISR